MTAHVASFPLGLREPAPRRRSIPTSRRVADLVVRSLPRAWTHALIRRRAVYPAAILADVAIDLVRTDEDVGLAHDLVREAYVKRGWLRRDADHQWIAEQLAQPHNVAFLLRRAGTPVGTVSLLLDAGDALPLERTFPTVLDDARRRGGAIAEVTALALDRRVRGTGLALCLVGSMWRYARDVLRLSDLVITVDPPVASYYEALFGFRAITGVASYEGFPQDTRARVEDPIVALHQRLASVPAFVHANWPRPAPETFQVRWVCEAPFPAPFERFA